jgi:hypothetical protein
MMPFLRDSGRTPCERVTIALSLAPLPSVASPPPISC